MLKPKARLTRRQKNIIKIVAQGNDDGSFVDIDELLERIGYEVSKESLQFSLRALIKANVLEKRETELRRSAHRRIIALTDHGMEIYERFILRKTPVDEFDLDRYIAQFDAGSL